ncbi:MAG: hypothetical protein KDC70_01220 [Saprospiraceae bacterium]|nr:hypothetical protein [Saprospiraceae bacterium]
MAISIDSQPPTGNGGVAPFPIPVPISDCLQWCLTPDFFDVFDNAGSKAQMIITFPATIGSIPADGTEFSIWGQVFEVDSTITDATSTKVKLVSSGNLSGDNLRKMLEANGFFGVTTVTENTSPSGGRSTKITWNNCGEQGNFSAPGTDITNLEAFGTTLSATNGAPAEYKPGYQVHIRLFKAAAQSDRNFSPISLRKGYVPATTCSTVGQICVDFMTDAARTLYCPMPDLSLSSEISPDLQTLSGIFLIEYGWTYRDANCQPVSGDYLKSDPVYVVNTVFDYEEKYGMRRFFRDHPDGAPPTPGNTAMFLSSKPQYSYLAPGSYAWLWLLHGFDDTIGGGTLDVIKLVFNVFYKNGTTDQIKVDYTPAVWYQVYNFNVSPGRVFSLFSITDPSTVSKYFVRAEAWQNSPLSLLDTVGAETYFVLDHSCDADLIDCYFRSSAGGIDTLLVTRMESTVEHTGTEICLSVPCGTSRTEAAKYGGRFQSGVRVYQKITISAKANYTDEQVRHFMDFKRSTERWIKVKELSPSAADITYIAKSFSIEPGGVKIFRSGEFVELTATGVLSDLPTAAAKSLNLT